MESIYNMNKEQILGLSPESVKNLIDYECALQGVRLLPDLPQEPARVEITPDQVAYKVGEFVFANSEDAVRVMEAITSVALYRTEYPGRGDYSTNLIKPVTSDDYYFPKMSRINVFSPLAWDACKGKVAESAKLKSYYDEAKTEYDAVCEAREGIAADITELISTIRAEKRRYDFYVAEFHRYLELAENNTQVAANFLTAAYKNIDTEFPELLEELKTDAASQSGLFETIAGVTDVAKGASGCCFDE